jgi:hypothetical protein
MGQQSKPAAVPAAKEWRIAHWREFVPDASRRPINSDPGFFYPEEVDAMLASFRSSVLREAAAKSGEADSGPCVSCGKQTEWACADCKIDTGITTYLCESPACRDKHEENGCTRQPFPAPPSGPEQGEK